jgi:hypothetical protein
MAQKRSQETQDVKRLNKLSNILILLNKRHHDEHNLKF